MVEFQRIFRVSSRVLSILSLCIGCVSGTVRKVQVGQELPEDLSKELQTRFAIRETESLPQVYLSQVQQLTEPNKKKKGKKLSLKKKLPDHSIASYQIPFRRALEDPVWIGEQFVYSISYFGVSAGDFTLEALPLKVIDGRKVYHVRGGAVSSSVFSLFYRLNDVVESFIDYDGLFSHRFHLVLDETKQTRDSLELYDSMKKQTFYWNRWNHKTNGYKETKEFGSMESFSQDSLSALYYLRHQKLEPGVVVSFPVVSEGKSFESVCTVVRRETIRTSMGEVRALVIRPEMKYQGLLKKSGDSYLWLTDDDRKIPIRLEAKVRIGTVMAVLSKMEPGVTPHTDSQMIPGDTELKAR